MKKTFTILSLALLFITAKAQNDTTQWNTGGDVGVNFSQVGFTNWAQGGQNSVSGLGFLHLHANMKKGDWAWDNFANFEYGLIQQADEIVKKSDDLLEFGTKIGHRASEFWYYTASASFKSQFTKGYDYNKSTDFYISNFMAPAYIFAGIGMDYKPNDNFSLYLSPITMKMIVVNDDTLAYYGAFGVQKEEIGENGELIHYEKTRLEAGAYLKFLYKKEIFKNVNFLTNLELYSNYLEDPQNVDVDWKIELVMKVNNFINASIKTHLIYDDNVDIATEHTDANGGTYFTYGPKTQFKEAIAVGLIFKFGGQ